MSWMDLASHRVWARLLDAGGAPLTDDFAVSSTLNAVFNRPAVAYSAAAGGYLVVWQDRVEPPDRIRGRRVDSSGAVVGSSDIELHADAVCNSMEPAVSASPFTSAALIGYLVSSAAPAAEFVLYGEDVPCLLVDPSSVSFGSLHAGLSSSPVEFSIANPSGSDLVIDGISLSGDGAAAFDLQSELSFPVTIPWAQTRTFSVLFAPGAVGSYAASVVIASNDPARASVELALTGSGTNTAPPAATLVFPAAGMEDLNTDITFVWESVSDADGDALAQRFYLGTTSDFAGVSPVTVARLGGAAVLCAGFGAGLVRRRRRAAILGLLALVAVCAALLVTACPRTVPEYPVNPEPTTTQVGYAVTGLSPSTTCYWKVVVDDGLGGTTESEVRSFRTR